MRNNKNDAEKELVRRVIEDFKLRQLERNSFESNWQLNINFYIGNQYCYISPAGEIVETGKEYFWQEKEVYNHIANLVELRLAKLSKVRPSLTVVPFSDDEHDVVCAKTSKKILKSISHSINLSKILSQGTLWSEICGTVFYKIDWNNNIGNIVGKTESGAYIHEGDIEVSVVSPFEIYPDSNTYNSIDDCMSIIYARSFHKDAVKNIWGVEVEGKDIDVYSLDAIAMSGGLGYSSLSNSLAKKLKRDQVLVLEKYEKPTMEYPNGRLIIVAGDKLIYCGELPYINRNENKRGFPFIRQTCLSTPNCFWGTSMVERCIPVQRAFNALKNRRHEYINRLTMGILTVEDGSLDIENLEEEGLSPGKVLIYRQGANAPKLLSSDALPKDFKEEESSLLGEFATITGVSDLVSRNVNPNISGFALQLMIEQDEVKLLSSAEEIRHAAKDIAKQILLLYKQYAQNQHTSRIVGENGAVELFYWKSSDINSEEVIFETENELNESLTQKRNMIFEILGKGLLHDEDGKLSNSMRSKILEQLGFGIWEGGQDVKTLQSNNAIRENIDLISNKEINSPLEIDDHDIHLNEHTICMLGSEFIKAVKRDECIQEKMLEHIREHKKYKQLLENLNIKED